jgi:hypothetical protein
MVFSGWRITVPVSCDLDDMDWRGALLISTVHYLARAAACCCAPSGILCVPAALGMGGRRRGIHQAASRTQAVGSWFASSILPHAKRIACWRMADRGWQHLLRHA